MEAPIGCVAVIAFISSGEPLVAQRLREEVRDVLETCSWLRLFTQRALSRGSVTDHYRPVARPERVRDDLAIIADESIRRTCASFCMDESEPGNPRPQLLPFSPQPVCNFIGPKTVGLVAPKVVCASADTRPF